MSAPLNEEDNSLAAEAWTIRLSSLECTDAERDEFEDWLARAPDNAEAYVRAQRTHTLVRQLKNDDLILAELRRARRATPPRAHSRIHWGGVGLAATIVLSLGFSAWQHFIDDESTTEHRYTTRVGEQRSIRLSDGSQMILDTGSEVTAKVDARSRRVDLLRGQAQFVVAKDDRRPFIVFSADNEIRDIGTTFQVRNLDYELSVTLIEGSVSVRSAKSNGQITLRPGQRLRYDSSQRPIVDDFDPDHAEAWTHGNLFVSEQRLDSLLREINRYSTRKIRLADPADGAILISGKYSVKDQEALLKALQVGWSLRPVSKSADEIVLQ